MSHLLDDDDDDLQGRQNHRELTLGTGSVLGIFFGLALLCALFFAFGYNMGHKSAPPVAAASDTSDTSDASSTTFNTFKPAAGSPAGHTNAPAIKPVAATNESDDTEDAPEAPSPRPSAPVHVPATTTATEAPVPTKKPAPVSESASSSHPTPPPTPSTTPVGSFVVQVAAVSHQEDASLLVGALQRKGYTVAAHSEPQDKLIHIQVGPFSNHKDADAMRQRLLADGYNAIVK
ncbi:SPOR domain-containing protein [Granulicella mallensis]|uniref:Sporulation domain-containing protein n=1 Tax=Granulicella mallensis (strain ATCC BAA-1857 / DSM 23137 / MP5ACTX8) TaxID=682795 RepID=G8NUM4_GRAMM|nr:SPOR domain-containing protein [Granulicella mallensis]AEU36475.1 Sporulation domain-containing protein [Granulicella mallensis MP5ACTX8]